MWPIAQSFRLSLYAWNGDGPQTFVGAQNFVRLVQDKAYSAAFTHNVIFMVGYTVLEIVLGFFLAALLHTRIRGAVFFRTVYFLPVVVPTAVAALLWGMVLAPTVDPFSAFCRAVRLSFLAHAWLGDSSTALYAVVAITVWKNVGVSMIVYLAALQDVPAELLESVRPGVGAGGRPVRRDLRPRSGADPGHGRGVRGGSWGPRARRGASRSLPVPHRRWRGDGAAALHDARRIAEDHYGVLRRSFRLTETRVAGDLRRRLVSGPDERVLQEFGRHQPVHCGVDTRLLDARRLRPGPDAHSRGDARLLHAPGGAAGSHRDHHPAAVRRVP